MRATRHRDPGEKIEQPAPPFFYPMSPARLVRICRKNADGRRYHRANGLQTYNLGWLRFEGKGPSTSSDAPTLPVNATNDNNNNSTIGSDLGKGGVAGSSIPELGWFFSIDAFSAIFGALTAMGHLIGFAFYALALFIAQRLFRGQFRSDRCLFRPAAKGSASLVVWMVGVGVAGFYMAARERFVRSVLSTLHSEDFLCQVSFDGTHPKSFVRCRLVYTEKHKFIPSLAFRPNNFSMPWRACSATVMPRTTLECFYRSASTLRYIHT